MRLRDRDTLPLDFLGIAESVQHDISAPRGKFRWHRPRQRGRGRGDDGSRARRFRDHRYSGEQCRASVCRADRSHFTPRMAPRPESQEKSLQAILEGIASIERSATVASPNSGRPPSSRCQECRLHSHPREKARASLSSTFRCPKIVLEFLRGQQNGATWTELMNHCQRVGGVSQPDTARKALTRLRENGGVLRDGDRWSLAQAPSQAACGDNGRAFRRPSRSRVRPLLMGRTVFDSYEVPCSRFRFGHCPDGEPVRLAKRWPDWAKASRPARRPGSEGDGGSFVT